MMKIPQNPVLLRRPDVEKRTGLSRSQIYENMREGTFPRPVSLNGKTGKGRTVAWFEHEISAWIKSLPRALATTSEDDGHD